MAARSDCAPSNLERKTYPPVTKLIPHRRAAGVLGSIEFSFQAGASSSSSSSSSPPHSSSLSKSWLLTLLLPHSDISLAPSMLLDISTVPCLPLLALH